MYPPNVLNQYFKKVGSWFNFPFWRNRAGCFLVVLLRPRLLPQRPQVVWSLTLLPDISHAAWITTQLRPFDLWPPPATALHLIFLNAAQWHPQIGPVRETRVDRVFTTEPNGANQGLLLQQRWSFCLIASPNCLLYAHVTACPELPEV